MLVLKNMYWVNSEQGTTNHVLGTVLNSEQTTTNLIVTEFWIFYRYTIRSTICVVMKIWHNLDQIKHLLVKFFKIIKLRLGDCMPNRINKHTTIANSKPNGTKLDIYLTPLFVYK